MPGLLSSCAQLGTEDAYTACRRLQPLTQKKRPVQPGEWMDRYTEVHEPYNAYVKRNPTAATAVRRILYIVQLGDLDSLGSEIFNQAGAYLHAFYQIEVKILSPISIESIPQAYTRKQAYGVQVKTSILLDSLLPARLPDDAFALIAFTAYDLYPRDDWNFVFGQASLDRRVGVWSLARLGDYNKDSKTFTLCRERTLHVAVHETGHMFGIQHCVQYECCMNGSNSLYESDQQVPWLCWECLAKVCTNRGIGPAAHLSALLQFHRHTTHDSSQIQYYETALRLLQP